MEQEFAKYIRTKELIYKYAKGMRDIIGKEIHPYHELFFFLDGHAEFIWEHGKTVLKPYTLVIIPKEHFHQFIVHGKESDYIRCLFNFESVSELNDLIDLKLKEISIFCENKLTDIFCKLNELTLSSMQNFEKNILVKAYLAQLLVALPNTMQAEFENALIFHPITRNALLYINKNMKKAFTIADLSRELHVSASYLAHVFKSDLHISIHQYILEKRLIAANKEIRQTGNAMQAAKDCGFRDYSGFYKQYKKMFGISPSETKRLLD